MNSSAVLWWPAPCRRTGIRTAVVGLASGGVSSLAMPPFDWPVVLFATIPLLIWLIDDAAARKPTLSGRMFAAALSGWWFGFGYFLFGLWWIGAAFLVDAERFALLMPFAVACLPAGLALFPALAAAIAAVLWRPGLTRIVALAIGFTIAEWLRAHILTGFPWNSLGYAMSGSVTMLQAASLIGVQGLVPLVVLCAGAPAAFLRPTGGCDWRRGAAGLAVAALILAGLAGYGAQRLARAPDAAQPAGQVAGTHLRIVQPAISQHDKWIAALAGDNFAQLLALSAQPGTGGQRLAAGTVVIWPESAFPFFYETNATAILAIDRLLPDDAILLAGAIRQGEREGPAAAGAVYNSLFAIGDDGVVVERYDKVSLVPFGEYLPFQDILERFGLTAITQLAGGFSAGTDRLPMAIAGLPAALPLICYEIIFPGLTRDIVPRPGWLLNITNDAWFGVTPGPHQHFRQARAHAVEEGPPVMRSANTGISAVIDPYGRVVRELPLGAQGVIDTALPKAAPPTVYAQFGDWPIAFSLTLAIVAVVVMRRLAVV